MRGLSCPNRLISSVVLVATTPACNITAANLLYLFNLHSNRVIASLSVSEIRRDWH